MSESVSRKVVLPAFTLTEICKESDPGAVTRKILLTSVTDPHTYYYRPIHRPVVFGKRSESYNYNLMPVVVDGSGALWRETNLYILSRLEGAASPSMATYSGIADDLAAFKRFLEEEEIDFTDFPKRKLFRPTYRYRGDLLQRIRAGEMAPTTARRRMAAVIGFYRWLISEGFLRPEHPPWNEGDVYFQFTDSKGFSITKQVKTTDIAVRVAKQNDPYAGTIDDGGKLRPLTPEEQEWLLDALLELGNTEMTLIHLVALFTGARIQTVLTFRVRHVHLELPDDVTEVRLPVGSRTTIDTKNDKQMTLFIPRWLFEKLRVYSHSDRARKHRKKAGDDSEDQYLFLSNRGVPLYKSKADRQEFDESHSLRHEKDGQTVRQFITDRVIPLIRKKTGTKFHYRFHDMRASYGMNLTDQQLTLIRESGGKVTLHQVREFVKTRMGHESAATTDRYLNYRSNQKFIAKVQSEYESHLKSLADKAKGVAV